MPISSPSTVSAATSAAVATNTTKTALSPTTATRIPSITNSNNIPLTPLPEPERGSLSRPYPQQQPPFRDDHPVLVRARCKLLSGLPGRRDHVLRSLITATGQLKHPQWAKAPRSDHTVPASVEAFIEYRNYKFKCWRKRTGYAEVGGGLVWGNLALLALRKNQVRAMWPECLELAHLQEAELWEQRGEVGVDESGICARMERKVRGVGRALGMPMRELTWEKVAAV